MLVVVCVFDGISCGIRRGVHCLAKLSVCVAINVSIIKQISERMKQKIPPRKLHGKICPLNEVTTASRKSPAIVVPINKAHLSLIHI